MVSPATLPLAAISGAIGVLCALMALRCHRSGNRKRLPLYLGIAALQVMVIVSLLDGR